MEELIFVSADGERETLHGVVNEGSITIEANFNVAIGQDFTRGYFERRLSDVTIGKLQVTTYRLVPGDDGGAWFVVSVEPM